MVSQLSNKFEFLKKLNKNELAILKREVKLIVDGGTQEQLSEITERATQTLNEFRTRANSTANDREFAEARKVMKVCAGCGGIIRGKEYWAEVVYTNMQWEKQGFQSYLGVEK